MVVSWVKLREDKDDLSVSNRKRLFPGSIRLSIGGQSSEKIVCWVKLKVDKPARIGAIINPWKWKWKGIM
ncbi:hypothetical protein OROHE_019621 [Orobanche hederae]